jgi:hypothetical protein
VEGETATPARTLPPTDTLGTSGGPTDQSWRLVLFAIAGVLGIILLVTPASVVVRREHDER